MSWKRRQQEIQVRLAVRQNRIPLMCIGAWFALSLLVLLAVGLPPLQSLKVLAFFEESNHPFGFFYQSMTDILVMGLVVSMLLVEVQRDLNPELASRVLADELQDHAVVIEFSNLGRRAFDLLAEHDIPVAVVEEDRHQLEDLIRDGYPCLVGHGRSQSDLLAVNVDKAKLVVIASDELESVAVIASLVRKLNANCELIVRVSDDGIGEVLAKRYRAKVVSTSRLAAGFIKDYASKHKVERCIVVGCGNLGRALIPVLQNLNSKFVILSNDKHEVEDLVDEVPILFGKLEDPDLYEQANVRECDMVIVTDDDLGRALTISDRIRQVNTGCRILCRVYHDDAADMLSAPPFKCDVISTSRFAVDKLRRSGGFQAVGLGPPKK